MIPCVLTTLKSGIPEAEDQRNLVAVDHPSVSRLCDCKVTRTLANYLCPTGITLIELMIAICIIGILAGIAIPNFVSDLPKYRLNGAANQVQWDLMKARMRAISNNKKVKIYFSGDHQYKICQDDNDDGTVEDCEGSQKIVNIGDTYQGITINSNNNPIFNPRGTASNLATISITNSSGTKNIKVSITGRIQIN